MGERRNEDAQYIAEKRTIQILEVLRRESDSNHRLSQNQILELLKETGEPTTENIGTLSRTLDEILIATNPERYDESNDEEYKIKYKDYEKNLVVKKEKIKIFLKKKTKCQTEKELDELVDTMFFMYPEDERIELASYKKAPPITDINYVHDFSDRELDQLMDAVNFSSHLSQEEKRNLMHKIQGTASKYYSSPFYDANKDVCRFNCKGIYGRFNSRTNSSSSDATINNIKLIQEAINNVSKIKFTLNSYDENGELVPGYIKTDDGKYLVSPYYIVVYQDIYYLIAGMKGSDNASHYRIDLMTDVEIATDEDGKPIKIDPLSLVKNLPNKDEWDPQKYMREHMYMFYGEPKKIRMLIRNANVGYTFLHDWFGKEYEIISGKRQIFDTSDEEIEIEVVCVPEALKRWAMMYMDRIVKMESL